MPKIAQDTIATSVNRLQGVKPENPPSPDLTKEFRVFIGPANYAGQGDRWARALEETGRVSARNFVHTGNNPLGYKADYAVSWRTAEHSRKWQRMLFRALSNEYTHVLIEASIPIIGGLYDGDMKRQIADLQAAGIKVAMVAHGNEVRLPSAHIAREPWSQFTNAVWEPIEIIEPVAKRNIQLLNELHLPTFVSTAGLLEDLPYAKFLGVIVDTNRWKNDNPLLTRERPRVVHAPTNPALKGTTHITPIVRKLHDEGLIEFVELNNVPHDEMPTIISEADIVLDQFRVGDYGVAACEAMAASRLVLAHISDQIRDQVKNDAGVTLPIVETTLDNIEERIREILSNREKYRLIAATGPAFVNKLHNGEFSSEVLFKNFLKTPLVDVTIAVHSATRPVARAVASILDHTREPVRVNVVAHNIDKEIIAKNLQGYLNDDRVRLLHLVDNIASPAGPMNFGISHSTAPFIAVLGSDDELEPGAIDSWLKLQRATGADVVLARIQLDTGKTDPYPPVRNGLRTHKLNAKKDRLFYRSAPLGLIDRNKFGSLRFTEGFSSGEDLAYSMELWQTAKNIAYDLNGPCYVINADAVDRVTSQPRPVADDFLFLDEVVNTNWFTKTTRGDRVAMALKIIRIHYFDAVLARAADDEMLDQNRAELLALLNRLETLAPGATKLLSRADRDVFDQLKSQSAGAQQILDALQRRHVYKSLPTILTRNLLFTLHRQAPFRTLFAGFKIMNSRPVPSYSG